MAKIALGTGFQDLRTLVVIPIASVNLHQFEFAVAREKLQVIALKLIEEPNKTVGRLLRNKNGCGLAIVFQEDHLLEHNLREAGILLGYISPNSREAEAEISLLFPEGLGGVTQNSVHAE